MVDKISPQLKQYRERVLFYIDLLGGICSRCGGQTDLEFDHIEPGLKSFTITDAIARSVNRDIILEELKKCHLLCQNCHKKKTMNEDGFKAQHGTGGMYRHHGCRCEACRMVNRQYSRDYHQRRKRDERLLTKQQITP